MTRIHVRNNNNAANSRWWHQYDFADDTDNNNNDDDDDDDDGGDMIFVLDSFTIIHADAMLSTGIDVYVCERARMVRAMELTRILNKRTIRIDGGCLVG